MGNNWFNYILMWLAVEFCYYWVHRTGHTIYAIWISHSVHHSSEYYNLTTALRQSAFNGLTSWIYYLPLAFVMPTPMFLIHKQINLLYQFWIHTESVPKLGPIEWIFNTPSQHRVHHAKNPIYIDVNYGATLCIFDRLFGTFQEELDNEKPVYGVIENLESFDAVYANIQPYYKLAKKVLNTKHFVDGINVLYQRPGWISGTYPAKHYPIPIPSVSTSKYDPSMSRMKTLYVTIQFVFLAIAYVFESSLMRNFPVDSAWLIYGSFISLGAILNGSTYAKHLEMNRLVIIGLLLIQHFHSEIFTTAIILTQVISIGVIFSVDNNCK